jgi:hypothetical protein
MLSDIQFDRSAAHQFRLHLHQRNIKVKVKAMVTLDKMSLTEFKDLAAKMRHTISRIPRDLRTEPVELEDMKQRIAIRRKRGSSDVSFYSNCFQSTGRILSAASAFSNVKGIRRSG